MWAVCRLYAVSSHSQYNIAELRRVRYVVGNKFILDGDTVENTASEPQHSITQGLYDHNSDKLFDAR